MSRDVYRSDDIPWALVSISESLERIASCAEAWATPSSTPTSILRFDHKLSRRQARKIRRNFAAAAADGRVTWSLPSEPQPERPSPSDPEQHW